MAKEIVAMILAGGRGSRLYALTQKTAKPAVSFGGKYRIVDFPLSNCVNSDIDTVGIATQYQPQKLNEYIGNGQPWDLDRLHGGVHTLPPYAVTSPVRLWRRWGWRERFPQRAMVPKAPSKSLWGGGRIVWVYVIFRPLEVRRHLVNVPHEVRQ